MKNFSEHKISKVISWWQWGLLTDQEAERLIILHHNQSTKAYVGRQKKDEFRKIEKSV